MPAPYCQPSHIYPGITSSSCLLIDSTETPKSRANPLTWAHTQRTPGSRRSCSSFCSNPPEDWPESGRDQGPRLKFRTGSERFARFWTTISTVRDREAPGSNPGPPTKFYYLNWPRKAWLLTSHVIAQI